MTRQLATSEKLIFQTDGNLVVYSGSKAVWSSATASKGTRFVMQTDGNMVVYHNTTAVWASRTNGTGSSNYLVQMGEQATVNYPACFALSSWISSGRYWHGFWTNSSNFNCLYTYQAESGGSDPPPV